MGLAHFSHDAGYRTVIVQPANHYRTLPRWLYDFDVVYSGWDFDYQGATYRWATMPDQYVIDFIHRHEIAPARGPLLVVYTLITSHAPWSDQPPVVADWSRVGNGAITRVCPPRIFRSRGPISPTLGKLTTARSPTTSRSSSTTSTASSRAARS